MNDFWNHSGDNGLSHFLAMYDEWKLDKIVCKVTYLSSTQNAALIAAGIQG